jgi:hypothetical protein
MSYAIPLNSIAPGFFVADIEFNLLLVKEERAQSITTKDGYMEWEICLQHVSVEVGDRQVIRVHISKYTKIYSTASCLNLSDSQFYNWPFYIDE